ATVIEGQRNFSDRLDAWINLPRQIQAALVAERFGFVKKLLVDFEMPCRYVVEQNLTERLQCRTSRPVSVDMQPIECIDQCIALLQPAIDQQMHTSPAFLGVPTAL